MVDSTVFRVNFFAQLLMSLSVERGRKSSWDWKTGKCWETPKLSNSKHPMTQERESSISGGAERGVGHEWRPATRVTWGQTSQTFSDGVQVEQWGNWDPRWHSEPSNEYKALLLKIKLRAHIPQDNGFPAWKAIEADWGPGRRKNRVLGY